MQSCFCCAFSAKADVNNEIRRYQNEKIIRYASGLVHGIQPDCLRQEN
jgi:hypothetical protein